MEDKTSDTKLVIRGIYNFAKSFGKASLAGTVLCGTLLWYSTGYHEKKYCNFIEKTSISLPAIKQVDSLDNALDDLFDSERALTHHKMRNYIVMKHYSPDVTISLKELNSARSHIAHGQFSESHEVETLDDQIRLTYNNLSRIKQKAPEQFYDPQRIQIRELQVNARNELTKLKEAIPTYILEKRESLRNRLGRRRSENQEAVIFFSLIGLLMGVGTGLSKMVGTFYDSINRVNLRDKTG